MSKIQIRSQDIEVTTGFAVARSLGLFGWRVESQHDTRELAIAAQTELLDRPASFFGHPTYYILEPGTAIT